MADQHKVIIRNASILDPAAGQLLPDRTITVEGADIVEVAESAAPLRTDDARVVDARGRVVMPGLIDGHVHVLAYTANLPAAAEQSPFYVAARASQILRGMLDRGFTTVRDAAGADYGLADAVREGYFVGPRVMFGGKALSQTGGHGDGRHRGREMLDEAYCAPSHCRIVDGVDAVRKAVRDEIRRGAEHIKLMLGGGVASPTDRIDSTQFSVDEIRAAVEEATAANRYVMGHAYTTRAVNRGLAAGVRSIEHGNLIDESSVALFRQHEAFYVPTLATYAALAEEGPAAGLPPESFRKVFEVLDAGLHALELAHQGGVKIVYGTDLLGDMHYRQLTEFALRAQVQPPADILRSATTTAAELLGMAGRIGTIAPGAAADLLVVDGNPLDDVTVLTKPDDALRLIMHGGRVHKNTLDS
ncbi:MAG TPA: amidohydrolase family protein [Pseudonocardia sp.]|uniref:metal-dependent hydrolase family protein n=1 Tax=Pseudonocardia sp. TaxID=60912 RepID=UPI002CD5CA60|nr:amidohydrolase family protein [Pseudonocardia sp.]HTF55312.1 amidohydrolase family protein [Pseudonocardia sp.]